MLYTMCFPDCFSGGAVFKERLSLNPLSQKSLRLLVVTKIVIGRCRMHYKICFTYCFFLGGGGYLLRNRSSLTWVSNYHFFKLHMFAVGYRFLRTHYGFLKFVCFARLQFIRPVGDKYEVLL